VTGAALRMIRYHFFVAGAMGWKNCKQLAIIEGNLAELIRF